jgi:hypothetical protein
VPTAANFKQPSLIQLFSVGRVEIRLSLHHVHCPAGSGGKVKVAVP